MGRYIYADEFKRKIDRYSPDIRDAAKKELAHCKTANVVRLDKKVDIRCYDEDGDVYIKTVTIRDILKDVVEDWRVDES